MARTPKKQDETVTIDVVRLEQGEVTYRILGRTPLIYNAVSEKAKRELLLPRGKLNASEKAVNLKHDPVSEFRNSMYRVRVGSNYPTRLYLPSTCFKRAISDVAIDVPGKATKAATGRLTYVADETVPVWGTPRLFMSVVRQADQARTPDIRTRAILNRWATQVTIRFVKPILTAQTISALLTNAGFIMGVGDFRQQKGHGNYGLWDIVDEHEPNWKAIVSEGGMQTQDEAIASPVCHDLESEELLAWYEEEIVRRGREKEEEAKRPSKSRGRSKGNGAVEGAGAPA